MEDLDIIFRPCTDADCLMLNDWMIQEGWETRTPAEAKLDPFGRMKFAVNIAAEDIKTGTFLGIASYLLPRPNYAYFGLYMVHPKYRGIGVGKLLWNKAISDIGDRNIGINSHEMTKKYREDSGFKVVGTLVYRYFVPKSELLAKLRACEVTKKASLNEVKTNEDRENIVKFMQGVQKRTERYPEDDFMLGYMDLPLQHTVSASDAAGNVVGFGTIGRMGETVDRIGPIHAANDQIFLQILDELTVRYGRVSAGRLMVTISERREFALELVGKATGAELVMTMDQSFTRYAEYPEEYLKCFYCW